MSGPAVRRFAGPVLVTGSGSLLGGMVARALRAAGHDVRHMPPGTADNPELRGVLRGASRVFLQGTGTDAHQAIEMMADTGIPVVVLSDAVAELAAEFDVSGYRRIEDAVRASGLPCTILRPTDLSASALRWAGQFAQGSTVAAPCLDAYQEPVDEQDVADAVVALLAGERHHGLTYRLSGPHSLTRRDLIGILAAAAGRPKPSRSHRSNGRRRRRPRESRHRPQPPGWRPGRQRWAGRDVPTRRSARSPEPNHEHSAHGPARTGPSSPSTRKRAEQPR